MDRDLYKPVRQSLAGGFIEIRRYDESYVDQVYEAVDESRAELIPWMFWVTPEYSIDDARTYAAKMKQAWDNREIFSFIVFDRTTERVIGGCGLNNLDNINRRANLGYWVRSSETGRGVATLATRLLAGIAFEDIGLIRLELVMAIENKASRRVAEKAGARFEGVLRNRLLLRDGPHDAYSFSLIP